ncbi:trace amine-associated receptor 13c-like [Sander lucioperca]|uniref:Trace amine-associated receptor 13c-like n=1 Tax=Sander lucioperca TaxID=283035 RepID=A0A8D0CLV8_SANLU|nr:trace amine-associated receptor 13c-like [Sander lucioperca]
MEVEDGAQLCFPQFPNTSCRKPLSPWPETVTIVLYSISPITVALNLLIIISISHFRQLHTPTNFLLLSLAVSDFLVGLLLMPVEILRTTSCWYFGDLVCSMYPFIGIIITVASVVDIVLISVDRYVAICDPLHYTTKVTGRRVKIVVCLCWLCSFFYCFIFVNHDTIYDIGRSNSCYGECVMYSNYIPEVVDLVLIFIVPVTVIVALYLRIFAVAVSQARAMRSHITAVTLQLSVTPKAKKSELKAARNLGVLVVVFLMCFCPYYCFFFAGDNLLSALSASFVIYLYYFNSCLNPVMYALFYPWFRKSVKLIVTLQILQPGSSETNML